MGDINYFKILFVFVGGLGLLLYGMQIMADGLQKVAGSKMKKILEALTQSKFMSVIVGALVTGLVHSSTAVTVMTVGFVNAGLMNLSQTVGIIMGANIGTTVTSWLISSVEWLGIFSPSNLAPLSVGIGAGMFLFCKKEKFKQTGLIITGFGILFMGMNQITEACVPLKDLPYIKNAFADMGKNPLLGMLTGIIVTAILHSSAASVGILQSLALLNLIPWNSAVYIIMGQNIGTYVTTLFSSIGTSKNAKATAYLHLIFNLIGSLIFSFIAIIYFVFIRPDLGNNFIDATQISIIHSLFNLSTTFLLYPFSDWIIKIAEFLVRNIKDEDGDSIARLDVRILNNPNFAVQSCVKEIIRMGYMAEKNLKLCIKILSAPKENLIKEILEREKQIDILSHAIIKYLVKICNINMARKENKFMTKLFHTVNDIERVGDHCENLAEVAEYLKGEELNFLAKEKNELQELFDLTLECYDSSIKALEENNKLTAQKTVLLEQKVDALEKNLRNKTISRLSKGNYEPKLSVAFFDAINNLERIADHALNISRVVLKYKKANKNQN